MTKYTFYIPIPEGDPKDTIGLLTAIEEYRGGLVITDCVKVETNDFHVATAIQELFETAPELDYGDLVAFDRAWERVALEALGDAASGEVLEEATA